MKASNASRRLCLCVLLGVVCIAVALTVLLTIFLRDGDDRTVETSPVITSPGVNQPGSDFPTTAPSVFALRPSNTPSAVEKFPVGATALPTLAPTNVESSSDKSPSVAPSLIPSSDVIERSFQPSEMVDSSAPSVFPSSSRFTSTPSFKSPFSVPPTLVTSSPIMSREGQKPSAMPSAMASNGDGLSSSLGSDSQTPSAAPSAIASDAGGSSSASDSTAVPSSMPSVKDSSLATSNAPSSMPSPLSEFVTPPPSFSAGSSVAPSSLPKAPPPVDSTETVSSPTAMPSASSPQVGAKTLEPTGGEEEEMIGNYMPSPAPSTMPIGACEDKRGLVMFLEVITGEMQHCAWLAKQENEVQDLYCSSFESILSGCARTCGTCALEDNNNDAVCEDDISFTFSAVRPLEHTCQWLARRTNKVRLKTLCEGSVEAQESCVKTCGICQG